MTELQTIEDQLQELILKDKRNWVRTAKLLFEIEHKELYKNTTKSYTKYIQQIAEKNDINISTLWRSKSSAALYMALAKIRHINDLPENIKPTPEQLEAFGKVRTIAPEAIVSELQARMMRGENVRNELKAIWKTYAPLKQGKTERGRKLKVTTQDLKETTESAQAADQFLVPFSPKETEINAFVEENKYFFVLIDEHKRLKYKVDKDNMVAANLLNALRFKLWITETLQEKQIALMHAFTEVVIPKLAEKTTINLVAIVKQKAQNLQKPISFGVSVVVKIAELHNFEHYLENAQFFNYYYIAIPSDPEIIQKAVRIIHPSIGILTIVDKIDNTHHELKLIRTAAQNLPTLQSSTELFAQLLMKQISFVE